MCISWLYDVRSTVTAFTAVQILYTFAAIYQKHVLGNYHIRLFSAQICCNKMWILPSCIVNQFTLKHFRLYNPHTCMTVLSKTICVFCLYNVGAIEAAFHTSAKIIHTCCCKPGTCALLRLIISCYFPHRFVAENLCIKCFWHFVVRGIKITSDL